MIKQIAQQRPQGMLAEETKRQLFIAREGIIEVVDKFYSANLSQAVVQFNLG